MPAGIELDFLKPAGPKPAGAAGRAGEPLSDDGAGFAKILSELSTPPAKVDKPKHPLLMVSNSSQPAGLSDVLPGLSLQAAIEGELKARTATGIRGGRTDEIELPANTSPDAAKGLPTDAEVPLVLSALLKDRASLDVGRAPEKSGAMFTMAESARTDARDAVRLSLSRTELADDAAIEATAPSLAGVQPSVPVGGLAVAAPEADGLGDVAAEARLPSPPGTDPEIPAASTKQEEQRDPEVEETSERAAAANEEAAPVAQAVAAAPVPVAPSSSAPATPPRSERAQSILAAEPAKAKAAAAPAQGSLTGTETPQAQRRDAVEGVFSLDPGAEAADGLETQTNKPQQQTFTAIAAGQAPAAAPAAQPAAQPAAPVPAGMVATNAIFVAAPDDIVDVVSSRLSGAERPDRIAIQLDPPELGRVSIEFKFDGQTLQHVAVTGDTPEAMTKLRQMHAQLVQSLEQHGLQARDMSFSQNTPQRDPHWGQPAQYAARAFGSDADAAPAETLQPRAPVKVASGGLNIKL